MAEMWRLALGAVLGVFALWAIVSMLARFIRRIVEAVIIAYRRRTP